MSSRSRSDPWFRIPGERYEVAIAEERMRDPVAILIGPPRELTIRRFYPWAEVREALRKGLRRTT
jgi:hypothetical protein